MEEVATMIRCRLRAAPPLKSENDFCHLLKFKETIIQCVLLHRPNNAGSVLARRHDLRLVAGDGDADDLFLVLPHRRQQLGAGGASVPPEPRPDAPLGAAGCDSGPQRGGQGSHTLYVGPGVPGKVANISPR